MRGSIQRALLMAEFPRIFLTNCGDSSRIETTNHLNVLPHRAA